MYLLDTNALSELIRNPGGAVSRRLEQADVDQVCTSIIVAAEIRYGLALKPDLPAIQRVNELLASIPIIPFESPADQVYAEVRARLRRAATPIGFNDLFIAAHALALGATLVTDNVREFSRVEGLAVENWQRGAA